MFEPGVGVLPRDIYISVWIAFMTLLSFLYLIVPFSVDIPPVSEVIFLPDYP